MPAQMAGAVLVHDGQKGFQIVDDAWNSRQFVASRRRCHDVRNFPEEELAADLLQHVLQRRHAGVVSAEDRIDAVVARRQRTAGGLLLSRLCNAARRAGFSLWLRCRACGHLPFRPLCFTQCRSLLGRGRHRSAGGLLPSRLCSAARRAGFSFCSRCRACGHRARRPFCITQCRGVLGKRRWRTEGDSCQACCAALLGELTSGSGSGSNTLATTTS